MRFNGDVNRIFEGARGPTSYISTQRGGAGGFSFGSNVKKPTSWAKSGIQTPGPPPPLPGSATEKCACVYDVTCSCAQQVQLPQTVSPLGN